VDVGNPFFNHVLILDPTPAALRLLQVAAVAGLYMKNIGN